MELTKPEDLKYEFCWHCDHYTAICPHCNGNACACGCTSKEDLDLPHDEKPCVKSGFWGAEADARKLKLYPEDEPDSETIKKRLNELRAYYAKLSSAEKACLMPFLNLLTESEYWRIKNKATNIGLSIPSYGDFAKEIDVVPVYDCKTGKEWSDESPDISIISPLGWCSLESYENERIPWGEYCKRRHASECDYTSFVDKRKSRTNFNTIIAGDSVPGERIKILSGSCANKIATVVENNGRNMVKVQVDGKEHENLIAANNGVIVLSKEANNGNV